MKFNMNDKIISSYHIQYIQAYQVGAQILYDNEKKQILNNKS